MNRITIGIPVLNEEDFIEASVHSAAPQCEVLFVADNCSTDRTEEICRRLAHVYPHLRYIRHSENKGATANFQYLLQCVSTEYFMWLGAHDCISENYVVRLKQELEEDPDASLAYGLVQHIDRSGKEMSLHKYIYAEKLMSDQPEKRLLAIIKYLSDCSLVHGLFRTRCVKEAWGQERFDYLAADHVLLARLAIAARFVYTPDAVYFRRSAHENDSSGKQIERIVGKVVDKGVSLRKTKMQVEQSKLMKDLVASRGVSGLWCFLGWVALIRRYGGYSANPIVRSLEDHFGDALNRLGRVAASIRRFG